MATADAASSKYISLYEQARKPTVSSLYIRTTEPVGLSLRLTGFLTNQGDFSLLLLLLNKACGAGTQISGSTSGSRHQKFLAQASAPEWFDPLKIIVVLYLYNSLAQQTGAMKPEHKFRLRLHHSKRLDPDLALAPVIQNCLGSGSTTLVYTRPRWINVWQIEL